jgi:hypothetical protein
METLDIGKMTVEERLHLVEVILESLDPQPVPPAHLKLIRERLANSRSPAEHSETAQQAIERIWCKKK